MGAPVTDLLPPNASPIERYLAATGAAIESLPIPIPDLGSAQTCPADVLPFLAWERSVDRWDAAWPEPTKRAMIDASFLVHQRKGTVGAIRRAIEPLGFEVRIVPWYEMRPVGRRGTFHLDVRVLGAGVNEALHSALERVIDDAKPLSRHLATLTLRLVSRGQFAVSVAAYLGDDITVYPRPAPSIAVAGQQLAMGAIHINDILSVSQECYA